MSFQGRSMARTRSGLYLLGALACSIPILTGCARLMSIQRNVNFAKQSITIDAEQRVVISTPTKPGNPQRRIVCAEPSPDVFKVRGASFSALLDQASKQDLEVALAASEAGQNIGLRTQSIQLLRDAMYRACEGAAGGMLSESDFSELQTRFQKLTAVLLATEQLTGAVRPNPSPIIAASGSASTGANVVEAQKALDEARADEAAQLSLVREQEKKKEEAERQVVAAQKAFDEATADEQPAKKLELEKATKASEDENDELDKRTDRLEQLSANTAAAEEMRDAARSASSSTKAGGTFVPVKDNCCRPIPTSAVREIAKAISGMVTAVFDQDSGDQMCLRHYIKMRENEYELKREAAALRTDSVNEPNDKKKNFLALEARSRDAAATKLQSDADALRLICEKYIEKRTGGGSQ